MPCIFAFAYRSHHVCIQLLLSDSELRVRCLAIDGAAHVMSVYWELLPATLCKTLLQRLANLAFDLRYGFGALVRKLRCTPFALFIIVVSVSPFP